jgi:5-hydroxyisourate hydrolase-like protein (transthyretin family)
MSPGYKLRLILFTMLVTVLCFRAATVNANAPFVQVAGTGSISGQVTDEGGIPLANILVEALRYEADFDTWLWAKDALTEADGSYLIARLEAGRYRLRFTATSNQNYAPEWYDDVTEWDEATELLISQSQAIGDIDAALAVGGSISGQVTDEQGNPLSGIWINTLPLDYVAELSTQIPSYSTSTDTQGYYSLTGLPSGTFQLIFFSDGNGIYAHEWYDDAPFRSQSEQITVIAGQDTANIDAALAVGGRISGTVTDDASNPLINVWVIAEQYNPHTGLWESITDSSNTGSGGNYTLGGLAAGQYRVRFEPGAGHYAVEWYDDASSADQVAPVTVSLGQTSDQIDAALEPGGSISGLVTRQSDGVSIESVSVEAYHYDSGTETWALVSQTSTEQDGTYAFNPLPPGNYRVKFNETGFYGMVWYDDALYPGQSVDVPVVAGQTTPAIDAALGPGSFLLGSAVGPDNLVVGGTEIKVYRYDAVTGTWPWFAQTYIYEFSGFYWFRSLPPGTYRFEFRPPLGSGYATTWYGDVPDFESATDVVVDDQLLINHIDVTFGLTNTVSGQVTLDDAPLPGVTLTISSGQSTQTGISGDYYLIGLPDGSLTLTPTLAGYVFSPTSHTVTLPPSQSGLDFSATSLADHKGQVIGQVTNEADGVLPDIAVTAYQFQGSWQTISATVTLSNGTYALTLPVGEYRLFFADPGGQYRPQYYDNAPTTALAEPVLVEMGQTTPDINARLVEIHVPLIEVAGANTSVNPATGQVTIISSAAHQETVTITRTISCTGGADPTEVSLVVGDTLFPMTAAGSGQFSVQLTVPGDLPSGNQFDRNLSSIPAGPKLCAG